MVPLKPAQPMLRPFTSRACALLSTGTSMFSTSRPSTSHGSQLAPVPMVNPEMRTTGEHTTPTDPPSSVTTLANTHPKDSFTRSWNQGKVILVWML